MEDIKDMKEYASKYGKHDLERLGLFVEMPYMNGKGYVSPFPKPRPDKGRNIMGEGPKSKCATQHGYFDDEFRRIFAGEAIPKRPKKPKQKDEGRWVPPGPAKKSCGLGDYFGTFGGMVEYFSRAQRKPGKKRPELRNPMTSPGKKGGPGYVDIALSKYPEHLKDPYRMKLKVKQYGKQLGRAMITMHWPQPFFLLNPYRDENAEFGPTYKKMKDVIPKGRFQGPRWIPAGPSKWQGGCHAGLFAKQAEWMTERGGKKKSKKNAIVGELYGKYGPQSMAMKTMQSFSTMNYNTDMCVNVKNYKKYEPSFIKYWNRD